MIYHGGGRLLSEVTVILVIMKSIIIWSECQRTLWRFTSSQINAAHQLDQNQVHLHREGWLDSFISARLDADES